ncbi:MAG: MFS transporter [Rhodocyclaceae bacterium]|nr:MAG: MFS transporter [Rhodocyclaceae bacterium]
MLTSNFTTQERHFLLGIGFVIGLRQLVLLLVLPFIVIFGTQLEGSTPALVGLALGIYGLLQAFLQVPFGLLSDAFGRKRTILLGNALLALGLLIAALASDITTFIIGRALQGCGAVTAVAYAWIGDNTAPEKRNQAMSFASLAAGSAAVASFLAGPLLYGVLSLPQIFVLCAGLTCFVMLYVGVAMREPARRAVATPSPARQLDLRPGGQLLRLVAAGFLLNYILMAVCFILPLLIARELGALALWKVFVPATLLGIGAMRVATRLADAGRFTVVSSVSFAAFAGTAFCLTQENVVLLGLGMALFMSGYLVLAALLPAAVSRVADAPSRATATGIFYTAMFLGAFAGGAGTGALWGIHPGAAVAVMIAASAAGLVLAASLPSPRLATASGSETC